nr:hypothetical protein [Tanacetum cinerariifolium]
MTGAAPPNPPVILLSDKLQALTNLHTRIPVLLDVDEMNYSSWMYFFQNLCRGYNLLTRILGEEPTNAPASSDPPPKTAECLTTDSIILTWITTTLFKTLQQRLVVENSKTEKEAWDILDSIFSDNKRSRSIAIATILSSLGSPVSNDDVVNIAFDELPEKYQHVSNNIIHRGTFPDLKMVCSMLTTTEMRLKSRAQVTYVDSSSFLVKGFLDMVSSSRSTPKSGSCRDQTLSVEDQKLKGIAYLYTWRTWPPPPSPRILTSV